MRDEKHTWPDAFNQMNSSTQIQILSNMEGKAWSIE